MEEVGISVVARLAEYLVQPTISVGRYLFCGTKITRNLESEKEKLTSTRESVKKLVQEALNRTEKVNNAVEKWIEEGKTVIVDVENLEQELKANNGCFQGWFPNCKRYRLFKEMAKKTEKMIQLNTNNEFNPFSYRATLPDIEYFSSRNFMYFKSTKLAWDELLEALRDDISYMIGLYGMGGSGKTTLAKEVGKKAKEAGLFDRVIFTTISQTLNVKRIQQEIADLLGLKFYYGESEAGRAREVSLRLQRGERILMILDDVWAKINLEDIGITFYENHNNFKVLLTTRRLQVCTLMDCQKKIPLYLLYEDEAWTLLQKHAGIDDKYFKLLNGLAQEVARECKGLHIAIEAVGTSLKEKSVDEWEVALDRLKNSKPIDVEDGVSNAFTCLQLSYNYLRSKEVKLLFLMCSIFPEDHDISIEDLFRYGIGLGLYGEVDSFEIARSQVNAGIKNLISSCLLMHSEKKKDHVKMHDMVRDVALWIASKEDLPIFVNLEKELNMLAEDGAFKNCYAISSYNEEIYQIPHQLDAPKLEILILNTSYNLKSSHASFEGVKRLKVMAIAAVNYIKGAYVSLPQSTWLLTNLRTLCLVARRLGDISSVVSLTRLEILDLRRCSFKLPHGIEKLNKLKLLDLSWSDIKNSNCYEVIRRCSQLQELYVFGAYFGFVVTPEHFPVTKLQRYALQIGKFTCHKNIFPRHLSSKRSLYLGELNIFTSHVFVKDLLQRAEDVYLGCLQGGCKSIIPDFVQAVGDMSELTKLRLDSCSEIECLFDTSSYSFQMDAVLPRLVKLVLENMDNLSDICCGPPLLFFFENVEEIHIKRNVQLHRIFPGECNLCNLKILRIKYCPALMTSLFPMSIAQTLVLLQELTVKECRQLKCVVTNEGEEIIPDNAGLMFPKLKILSIGSCQNLEFIFPISCAQGLKQLQEISVVNASDIKYVFGQHEHEGQSDQTEILLPLLKELKLEGLPNLLSVCPENYHSWWPSLTKLQWVNCPNLSFSCMNIMVGSELRQPHPNKGKWAPETRGNQLKVKKVDVQNCGVENIFHLQGVGLGEDQQELTESTLETLRLENLHELRFIWTGPSPTQILTLQYLQHLEVYHCGKLKSIFSSMIYTFSLPKLTHLTISDCEELEDIIANTEEPNNLCNDQVCFPKLRELKVLRCNNLKSLFSAAMARMLPQLKFLSIVEAAELVEGFRHKNGDCTNNREEIMLPNLREIELIQLPNLTEFCQGFRLHSVKIHKVVINDCPKLNSISGGSQLISTFHQRIQGQQANGTSGSQLCDEVSALLADLNVYELKVNNCLAVNIFYSEGVESIASILVRLSLRYLPELRLIWMASTHFLSLHCLQHFSIYNCEKLKCVFSAIIHRSLPQLTSLTITGCKELEEIFVENEAPQNQSNTQVCFPKLAKMEVEGCHKLKSLFSTTMARVLPQLTRLTISDCAQLKEIFRCGTEDSTNNRKEIVLPNLRQIYLRQLPSLIDICQGFTLQAVKLMYADIDECPKFTPILGGNQAISVHQSKEAFTDGVTSLVISALHAILNVKMQFPVDQERGLIMVANLEKLYLKNLPELMFIWEGPTLISFQVLNILKVIGCRKLKCIFSAAVIRSLPQVWSLDIRNCEELEEIISDGEGEEHRFPNPSSNSLPQQACFPKLSLLIVEGCSRLKCLFPISILGDLPRLNELEIRRCSHLEQVFGCVPENHDKEVTGLAFRSLRRLILEELPCLTNIYSGFESKLQLEALKICHAKGCPIFPSTTIPALARFFSDRQIHNTDDTEEEEEEKNDIIVDSVGEFFHNFDNENNEDEDGDVDDDKEHRKLEDDEDDNEDDDDDEDEDEDIDLVGFLDN